MIENSFQYLLISHQQAFPSILSIYIWLDLLSCSVAVTVYRQNAIRNVKNARDEGYAKVNIYKDNLKNYEFKKGVGIDHCNKKGNKIKIMHLPAVANLSNS